MAKQEFDRTEFVKKQTCIIFSIIFLIVGFLSGVYFSKDIHDPSSQNHQQVNTNQNDQNLSKIIELKKWIADHPDDKEALKQLGNIYFDSHKYNDAIEAYKQYLVFEPKNTSVLTDLGVMYRRAEKPKKAIEAFDNAIQVDPKFETARFNKGVVLMHDLNDLKGAIKAWEKLVEINPLAIAPNGESVDMIVKRFKKEMENQK